jgi:hypothetical protein
MDVFAARDVQSGESDSPAESIHVTETYFDDVSAKAWNILQNTLDIPVMLPARGLNKS